MLVYVFSFSLLAAIGWHLSVKRFSLALLGSVVTSVILSTLLMFVFVGAVGPEEVAIFGVGSAFISVVTGKLIAGIKQK